MILPLGSLLLLLFAGGILSTIVGGGLGILTVAVGSFFFDVRTNIAVMSLLMIGIKVAKLFHFRGHARMDIVKWYVLPGIPLSYIGGLLLFVVPTRILEITLGILCLAMSLHGLWPKKKLRLHIAPTRTNLLFFGALNGIVGGLIGNASLIRAPALLSMGLRKEEFVATSTLISFAMNIAKGAAYAQALPWSVFLLMLVLLTLPVMFLSVYIGKKLLTHIEPHVFDWLQHAIILIGAVRLLFFS